MEPTNAQRRTADGIVSFYRGLRDGGAVDPAETGELADAIAAALAAERAKARAPFLALAEEFAARAKHHDNRLSEYPEQSFIRGFFDGQATAEDEAARFILKATQGEA